MEYLSSMYIDNEMDLNEKKQFLEKVRSDHSFYLLTLDLLSQEQLLQEQPILPGQVLKKSWQPSSFFFRWIRRLKPMGFATAGFATAAVLFLSFYKPMVLPQNTNRFLLFEPSAGQVELTGSFTGWQRIPMKQIGSSGYWELNLPVSSGEHRFAYVLDNDRRIADPTLLAREKDDFGGENSILSIEKHI